MTSKYLEQYERMQRSYKKLEALNRGRTHGVPSVHYEDDIYAFFMNCWHFKDWVKNDPTVLKKIPSIKDDVEKTFINGNEYLKLCGDVCNSLKHLENRNNRSGEDPKLGRKEYGLKIGAGQPVIALEKWLIDRNTKGPIDAFEVATECVKAWDAFLSGKGLN